MWPDDTPHRLVLAEVERMWRDACRPGAAARTLRRLRPGGAGAPPDRPLYVQKFATANWRTALLTGAPEATFAFSAAGLRPVEPDALVKGTTPEGFRIYHYPILAFAVHPDGERLALARHWGPKVASRARLRIVGPPGRERLRHEED
jgi:hypothetical protein